MITALALALVLSGPSTAEPDAVVLVSSLAEIDQAEQRKREYRVSLRERVTVAGRPYRITVTFASRERFEAERAGVTDFTLTDCDGVLRLGAGPAHEVLSRAQIAEAGETVATLIDGAHGTVSADAVLRCIVAREPEEHSFYVDIRRGAD